MIKEYFINNLSKIENDWKRLEIGTEMTSFQTYDWSLLLLKDIKEKLLRSIFWKPVFVCHLNSSGEVDMIAPLVVQSKSLNLRFYSMMSGICILGEKFLNPTHSLPQMPLNGLYFWKAISTPPIGM